MKQTTTLLTLTDRYLAAQGIETATADAARRRGNKTGMEIAARLDRLDEQTEQIVAAVRAMHAHLSGESRCPRLHSGAAR